MSWPPHGVEELRVALIEGVLVEAHNLELKRELPTGPRHNEELARDLASLSIDGGTLFIGIAEDQTSQRADLHPVPLKGVRERIAQVAQSRIDPPLAVEITAIDIDGSGNGVIVVLVPASPAAPHQVDGRYWGRADATKRILRDSEVLGLHEGRAKQTERIQLTLNQFIARDPYSESTHAHLHVVATPRTAPSGLFHDRADAESSTWYFQNILNGTPLKPLGGFHPDFSGGIQVTRATLGWMLHSGDLATDGSPIEGGHEKSTLSLTISEDGEALLYCGRGSDSLREGVEVCIEPIVLGLTKRVVLVAAVIADAMDYMGTWDFGISLAPLKGVISYRMTQDMIAVPVPYGLDEYRAFCSASHADLANDVNGVVHRLCGRLNRALNRDSVPIPP